MLKLILVGLGDLAYSRAATAKAIELAQAHGARLTGVTLFDADRLGETGPIPIGAGQLAKELKESRLENVGEIIRVAESDFATACESAGVQYTVRHENGDPLESLISLSRYHDLVICGLKSLCEYGVVEEPPHELANLVREGVRPLLAVTDEDRAIQRVLIAYSGSMESAKTMKHFVNLGLWPQATVRIVTFQSDQKAGQQRVDHAADYCRAHGLEPETEAVEQTPRTHLLSYADEWGADLIVMGNSAKSMLLRQLLGETALHVMRNSDLPLFLAQ